MNIIKLKILQVGSITKKNQTIFKFKQYIYKIIIMERAKEFMRKLREFLGGDNHIEVGTRELGNVIELPCFNEHIMDTNSMMAEPYTCEQLLGIMLGLQEFIEEVISIDSTGPSCNELGRIIDELIEDGLF
jgi:hypothetical protein